MLRSSLFGCLLLLLIACSSENSEIPAQKDAPLISYVNPFIGTGGHGHTYPGATLPFGMMQLSPDTRLEGWDGCSGYHYSDNYIYGFSHTHLSGTGVSDYGDILLMPTNEIHFNNGADNTPGYRAHFSHENEKASPGYYSVQLDSTNIRVSLTVTKRAGMHRYQFSEGSEQVIILDLLHRDKLLDHDLNILSETEVSGTRVSEAWAHEQHLYFHIIFSHPFRVIRDEETGKKAAFILTNPKNEPVFLSVGISAVDQEGAKKNLEKEIGVQSFETIRKQAAENWEKQLEKIVIESEDLSRKRTFYTALYHSMIAPNLYQDIDGRYRGMDLEVHQNKNFDYYTVFSLWDTFRATHPLYTLIERERTSHFIQTMLAKYDEGGILPIWDLAANYTGCMIGYHGVSVIADAYLKGIRGFDVEKAFKAMEHSAMQDHLGLENYKSMGYIAVENESESVSKTLEYAYDDWTIAQMAKALGKEKEYGYYLMRAQNYKQVFDPGTGFMRGRIRNSWFTPFDPFEVNFNYTEANAWQYSLFVPQDINGLINLHGGKTNFIKHLDALFTASHQTSGREQADITGLIGQYAHGNEPSHHMAYLYNFVNQPNKTQERVKQILTTLYSDSPDGISGNEDCGQMSAWYVMSSLGFYPVTPGSNHYIIGTPLFNKATISFEDGKALTIQAENLSDTNLYIENVFLNGKPLDRTYLTHEELIAGGKLLFVMTDSPSDWGTDDTALPVSEIVEHQITPAPFIAEGNWAFRDSTRVKLQVPIPGATIYYKLNDAPFLEYQEPFTIQDATILNTYAESDSGKSAAITTEFKRIDPDVQIALKHPYANQYNGGGPNALIDGQKGTHDFRTGSWQGFQDTDLIAVVDLGKLTPIDNIEIRFLQDQKSWIFYPSEVRCSVSDQKNGHYKELNTYPVNWEEPSDKTEIRKFHFNMKGYRTRFIRIHAKNPGDLPAWHLGAPSNGKAWIFSDEITINKKDNP